MHEGTIKESWDKFNFIQKNGGNKDGKCINLILPFSEIQFPDRRIYRGSEDQTFDLLIIDMDNK